MVRKRKIKKKPFYKKRLVVICIVTLIVVTSVFVFYHIKDKNNIFSSQSKAVIIDQLSSSLPNQTFIDKATSIIEESGYIVDYYPSSMVTVDFYKNLPKYGYDIIIIRAHSTIGNFSSKFALFTSEEYDTSKYVYNQLQDQVGHVKLTEEDTGYFGIYPNFVKSCMQGDFNDAIVVMMGCGGSFYPDMTTVFIDRGVSAYFGWNERVDIDHTDHATICLLENLLEKNCSIGESIDNTMDSVGPDPKYNSIFTCELSSSESIDIHMSN